MDWKGIRCKTGTQVVVCLCSSLSEKVVEWKYRNKVKVLYYLVQLQLIDDYVDIQRGCYNILELLDELKYIQ